MEHINGIYLDAQISTFLVIESDKYKYEKLQKQLA